MKHQGWGRFVFTAILAAGAGGTVSAFVATSPDSELFATGTISAQENDNLFLSHTNAKSDTVFDLIPGLEWDFGKNSVNTGRLTAGDDIQLFASDSKLDTNLPMVGLTDTFDDQKTKFTGDANYQKLDQATRDVHLVGSLIKRDWYHVDGTGEVSLTDKTSVSLGGIYDDTEYQIAGYENWQWINIPAKYYYKVEPKLDVSAGISYQNNTIGSPGIDSNEYFYNVGARGEFTAKLTGEFSVGYEQIQFKHGGKNTSGIGANSNFTYAYTPKTSFTLGIQNGYGYSPVGGNSYRNFGVTLGGSVQLTEQWLAGGQVGYNNYKYISSTENDDFYSGGASVSYVVSPYVSLKGAYSYNEDDSNIVLDRFTNNIFSLSVILKY